MQSALLANGKLVSARSYDESLHGNHVFCIDKCCGVPVFFVPGSLEIAPYFKTSGRGQSIHKNGCGFAKKLTFQETVEKVHQYQESLQMNGIKENIIRLNLNSLDPDYTPNTVERQQSNKSEKDKSDIDENILKESDSTPKTIGSLKTIRKLFTQVDPDILATIVINVKGKRVPISELIRHYDAAHLALWNGETIDVPYFIHGVVEKVTRREKVWFVNFKATENGFFSLVVFERYFEYFTFKDDDLVGKDILAYGNLKRNTFNENTKATEMIIKSNDYIIFL